MASKQGLPKKKVKPRLPLPTKPPKAEPNPKAYERKQKHKRDWIDETNDNASPAEEDR